MCICITYIYVCIYITQTHTNQSYFLNFSNVYLSASFAKCLMDI